jgi:uncharacterized protein involved in tellurium resistance
VLNETVTIDLDVGAKYELSEQVRGTIQSRNEHMKRFRDQDLFSYKQLSISTANARKASAAQKTFVYLRSFLQHHDNML